MKIILIIVKVALLITVNLLSEQQKTITATVVNISNNEGKVSFALYNKETFMKTPLQAKNAKVVNGRSTVVFENLESGTYAILCFHDRNNNGKMDFKDNGMPMEDYGVSNNVMSFAQPSYQDAKFDLGDKDLSLEIKF
ncbi:MAG: DUF2141 domain-containing protein [Flavobacteriales bacterium]|nr:DUF2141 domain-containing protein [Flavobacteriales bacterium]